MSRPRPGQTPRSVLALLTCVTIEAAAYFVWLLTQSTQDPANCDEYCWSDRDIAWIWGAFGAAPLVVGQLIFGGIAIALAARKDNWGIPTGLLAFLGATALTLPLMYLIYFLQTT